jgi:hypothetical protein
MAYDRRMSRNPFESCASKIAKGEFTEFGFGAGQYPRLDIDFSQGGFRSGFPIADPDHRQQMADLRASRRTDLTNPVEPDLPAFQGGAGMARMHTELGNTDRYGAGPPLVRETKVPYFKPEPPVLKPHMEREA